MTLINIAILLILACMPTSAEQSPPDTPDAATVDTQSNTATSDAPECDTCCTRYVKIIPINKKGVPDTIWESSQYFEIKKPKPFAIEMGMSVPAGKYFMIQFHLSGYAIPPRDDNIDALPGQAFFEDGTSIKIKAAHCMEGEDKYFFDIRWEAGMDAGWLNCHHDVLDQFASKKIKRLSINMNDLTIGITPTKAQAQDINKTIRCLKKHYKGGPTNRDK